jgi:NAD(P)-dependent dehydrogenase (short-subunit alcohol dehydrogenase family)
MPSADISLTGKTALITGAGGGIGAETARQLDRRGVRLALLDINGENVESVASSLRDAVAFQGDVTNEASMQAAVQSTVDRFGGIDIVMANAGVAFPGILETQDPAEFERTIQVNLLGVWRTLRLALPHLIDRRGYALAVASLAAPVHAPLMTQYSAAKAGVEAFGNAMRAEVAYAGVDVGVAYFAYIDTPMVRGAMSDKLASELRKRSSAPLGLKDYPVEEAADAVVQGMERRSRVVMYPRWMRPILAVRGFLQPLLDRQAKRLGLDGLIRQAVQESRGQSGDGGAQKSGAAAAGDAGEAGDRTPVG